MIKLSIIIPFYNVQAYTDELLDCLAPQINKDIEVLVIDDGSDVPFTTRYDWVKIFHKENGGVSTARNMGINESKGEYLSFVDADDLVADDYVKQILDKIDNEHFDYLEMSWDSLPGGAQWSQKLNSIEDSLPNPSMCTRVFKRTFIGDQRFNEKKYSTEDEDFKRRLYYNLKGKKKAVITDYLYHYRTGVENSKSKRFISGEMFTKRIIYHYKHITKNMAWLIDEVAKENEEHEVFVLTEQNDLPELEYYCRVKKPCPIKGMELRGEPFTGFTLIKQAYKAQIILYISSQMEINGVGTWIYNFCRNMKEKKDIILLYEKIDDKQLRRLIPLVQCEKVSDRKLVCDYLIMCSIKDKIPECVRFKKSIQIIHTCMNTLVIPEDRDLYVYVSNASKNSFEKDGEVIPNFTYVERSKNLLLISTSRIGAVDKGDNDVRMVRFAKILNNEKVKYTWLYFADNELKGAPENMIHMKPTLDIQSWIRKADYLINLTDQEGFCYSIVEAMLLSVPVITTRLDVLSEIGFKDGYNGHIIPKEFTPEDLLNALNQPLKHPNKYYYDNGEVTDKWLSILGSKKGKGQYLFDSSKKKVQVIYSNYTDVELGRKVFKGEIFEVSAERAAYLKSRGLVDIIY